MNRAIMAPQYGSTHPYSGPPQTNLIATHQQAPQQNSFSYSPYSEANPAVLIPAYAANYVSQRPLPRMVPGEHGLRNIPYARNTRPGFVEEHHSQSPQIQLEPQWSAPAARTSPSPTFAPTNTKTVTPTKPVNSEVDFGTEVDVLMKAIQAKLQATAQTPVTEQSRPVVCASHTPPNTHASSRSSSYGSGDTSSFKLAHEDLQEETPTSRRRGKKRYRCTIEDCTKSFDQKTHLDIHERAHTGVKPYACKEPGCERSFSQLGNLKTHERRHTGERPYSCEKCGKRFAQRGNVRAHRIVHDQAKPYLCRLDDCGKQFTQLGNLKSHQNKFHIATIRTLTSKFASLKDGDLMHGADKEIWEYFANLYKNSNKGIKGRGKDRKVGANILSQAYSNFPRSHHGLANFDVSGNGRVNMVVAANHEMRMVKVEGATGCEVFHIDHESQSSRSRNGSQGSILTVYDDGDTDGFSDHQGRQNNLAFGDRIY